MNIGKGIPKSKPPKVTVFEKAQAKYPKPKVLLLDLHEAASEALIKKGFNVSNGTLGMPYKVEKSSQYQPVIGRAELPNFTEQEVVVADLHIENYAIGPVGEKLRPDEEEDLWAKCDRGFIDPRVIAAYQVSGAFNQTLSIGGVFVVFADVGTGNDFVIARSTSGRFGKLYDQEAFPYNVWHLLGQLSDMTVGNGHGEEMHSTENTSSLGRLVAEHLEGGRFLCTLQGGYRRDDPWVTLAENKFGHPVGICRCCGTNGTVIVLPQISDKAGFIEKLFTNVLPELAPHLFPHLERGKWTNREEYELTRVLELKTKQTEIEQRAREEVAALEVELVNERAVNGWLHDLLTGTDALLVEAVKKSLTALGFANVVDVDEERDREGKSRREDLQIRDQSPTLIVDIKGIGNVPTDGDALQADKHAAIRMREMKRTDVVGLSIINHQRHMPPLERENAMPFRQELLDAAEERMLGLMTAWDLYRLVRNFRTLGWRSEDIKPLFYKKGRIETIPCHYEFIGIIAKAWTDKFGVVITQGELRVCDRIAIEFPIEFVEADVYTIHVNNKKVERANIGEPAGILWPTEKPKLREGMRVFRILAAT